LRARSPRGPPAWRLEAIYGEGLKDFPGGFGPGRSRRQALGAPRAAVAARKAGWILDARASKDALAPFLANGRPASRSKRDSGQKDARVWPGYGWKRGFWEMAR
jgi:hypothetical protein